jgi:hypothetical protein
MKRAAAFLVKVIFAGAALLGLMGILALIQLTFHPFDGLIEEANARLSSVNGALSSELAAGVSIGTVVLVGILAAWPLFMKGVRAKQYLSSFMRSSLAAGIYFLSDLLYRWVEEHGTFYLCFAMVFMIVLTFVLVEIVARMVRAEEESSVRTDLLAAIVSGLVFGILVRLLAFGLGRLALGGG